MPPSLHVKRKRLPSTASLSNILIRLQPEKLAHLEQRSSLLSCLPSSQPQKQIRGETDRKLPSAKLPACWVKSFSLQLCKIKCNELHIRDCVKVSVLTSFPAFPSASQFYATKSNSSLFFCSENESHESLPTFILNLNFLISPLLGCLSTGATECLTQHVLSHEQKSCGFSCIFRSVWCRSHPSNEDTSLKIKRTLHWRLWQLPQGRLLPRHRDSSHNHTCGHFNLTQRRMLLD